MIAMKNPPHFIITWSIISVLCILALLGNGFIAVVNGYQWLQKGKLIPSDFLLICLSSSRFLFLLNRALAYILQIATPGTYLCSYALKIVSGNLFIFENCSLWCATWLSVLYCVKVTNFANPFFLWLKPRINVLAPRMLGFSIVLATIVLAPSLVRYYECERSCNLTGSLPMNTNELPQFCGELISASQHLWLGLASINFSLSAITSILLLISLGRHIATLRKSGAGMKDVSTQVHINVMKPLVFYLLGYLSLFIGMAAYSAMDLQHDIHKRLIPEALVTLFPLAHTMMLILTNPRLKKASAHMLNIKQRAF